MAKKLFGKCFSFWCRDFTKEGLTKPRNLLTIILEEMEAKGYDIINTKFYEGITVLDGENWSEPVRGHGLGMANSLTTLM